MTKRGPEAPKGRILAWERGLARLQFSELCCNSGWSLPNESVLSGETRPRAQPEGTQEGNEH